MRISNSIADAKIEVAEARSGRDYWCSQYQMIRSRITALVKIDGVKLVFMFTYWHLPGGITPILVKICARLGARLGDDIGLPEWLWFLVT